MGPAFTWCHGSRNPHPLELPDFCSFTTVSKTRFMEALLRQQTTAAANVIKPADQKLQKSRVVRNVHYGAQKSTIMEPARKQLLVVSRFKLFSRHDISEITKSYAKTQCLMLESCAKAAVVFPLRFFHISAGMPGNLPDLKSARLQNLAAL